MPGGSAAQQNSNEESPNEIGADLARAKAESAGAINTGAAPANDNNSAAANDNYQPYSDEQGPANDNNISAANDNISEPFPEGRPTNDNNAPQEEEQSFSPDEEAWFNKGGTQQDQQQAQLDAQQQADAALSLESSKQRQLQQIQRERQNISEQLGKLENDLTDFKKSKLGGFLKIFQPRINLLIDILIEEMKKQANKLTDEAKVGYYTGLVMTVTSLIGMLTAFKFIAAVLDAAFVDSSSCLRLAIVFSETIVIPIILILLSPIYISFLAVIFIIGKIPLLKGRLTKNIIDLLTKLKKQRDAWQVELTRLKKVVGLKKQLKSLNKFEKQVKRWR